jgi:hypothetical protein
MDEEMVQAILAVLSDKAKGVKSANRNGRRN